MLAILVQPTEYCGAGAPKGSIGYFEERRKFAFRVMSAFDAAVALVALVFSCKIETPFS